MKRIPPVKPGTAVPTKQSDSDRHRRRFSKIPAPGLILLAVCMVLTGNFLYGQESDDALFIDENGNVAVGKKLTAEKFEGDGSAITVGGVEFVKQVNATPPLTLQEVVRAVIADMVPIGTIMAYGGDVTNQKIKENLEAQGWLPCDGAQKEVSNYKILHDIIGNAFGGDGNYFYLPDMRGRFLRGVNYDSTHNVGGKKVPRDPDVAERRHPTSGKKVGGVVGSVQKDAIEKHKHKHHPGTGNVWLKVHRRDGTMPNERTGNKEFQYSEEQDHGKNETRPKNIYVNWIIKAKHIIRTR